MGVKGLQTFLKENRQSLCTSVQFDSSTTGVSSSTSASKSALSSVQPIQKGHTSIVIDSWGIIFQLYLDSLSWTAGGEYLGYYRLVRRLVESLRSVDLEPTFVFDGSTPPEKHETILRRLREKLQVALLFHTTSVSSRSSPSFSRHSSILPPFTSQAFIHALNELDVSTYHAASGEADGVCFSIANELGAYVLGLDSDFMILVSSPGASNVKGYCPLDMLQWIEGPLADQSSKAGSRDSGGEEGEWSCARPKRVQHTPKQSPLLPPLTSTSPSLVLTVITPNALCHRLRLPPSVLPLFASLIGNDYTPPSYADLFFEPGLTHVQKVEKVARILRETVFAPNATKPGVNDAGDHAVLLVKKVIKKLAFRGHISDIELQEIVNVIIESTFRYILPGVPHHPALYPFDATPSTEAQESAKERYAASQKRGLIPQATHAYLYPKRVYVWPILEDPSGPSLRGSHTLREVRKAAWGIIEEGCGGLCWPEPIEEEVEALHQDLELQDLLGVTKDIEATLDDTSDGTTPIDEEKHESGAKSNLDGHSPARLDADRSRIVIEHVRQGSSQKVNEIAVPLLQPSASDTPQSLLPIDERLKRYLEILSSDTPTILALPPQLHPLLASLRLCIIEFASRSDTKWRKTELLSVLKVALGMHAAWEKEGLVFRVKKEGEAGSSPVLYNRSAAIVAQISAVMLDQLLLAQALVILPEEHPARGQGANTKGDDGARLTHLTPFMFFSGIGFHTMLNGGDPPLSTGWRWAPTEEALLDKCAAAIVDGIEDMVLGWNAEKEGRSMAPSLEERLSAGKKAAAKRQAEAEVRAAKSAGSRFDLLNGMSS